MYKWPYKHNRHGCNSRYDISKGHAKAPLSIHPILCHLFYNMLDILESGKTDLYHRHSHYNPADVTQGPAFPIPQQGPRWLSLILIDGCYKA